MKVLIVGGGNSAHILIPLLSTAGHQVSLLTSRPEQWSGQIRAEHHDINGNCLQAWDGILSAACDSPAKLVPDADVIVLCLPVHSVRRMLHKIAPYIPADKTVFLLSMYGQAGFNWMAEEIIKKFHLDNIVYLSFGLIPWIARTFDYGKTGITYGCKTVNVAAISDRNYFGWLNENLLGDFCEKKFGTGAIRLAENFLSLTLSVDNQIIHPSRCYALYRQYGGFWDSREAAPYFYRDYDNLSAEYLQRLDNDFTSVRKVIRKRYPELDFQYMLDYLALEHLSYSSHSRNIVESFTQSVTLGAIKTPVIQRADGYFELDYSHRFFKDDYSYGIGIVKWFAEKLELQTPMIDELIRWIGAINNVSLLDEHNKLIPGSPWFQEEFCAGLPECYGLKTVEQCLG